MPSIGQHEIAQRLVLSGTGSLHTLKANEQRVLKTLFPLQGVWGEAKLREEIDAFLLRAKTQKRLASKCTSWAPIYETAAIPGTFEEADGSPAAGKPRPYPHHAVGAYAILDRYERSVHSLIEGRVNVTNDDLRTIFSGTIRGLIDIRTHVKRPHGDLKPTNILLKNTTDLAAATVHLTDPAADGALTAASDKKDLTDLAKILYELVNLRPYLGGTIGRTADWNELGPNGEDWRRLCNGLLGYTEDGAEEHRDLEKILATIDTWREKPKKSKAPLVAAAVLLALAAGGVTAFILTRPPKLDFDQPQWEKLCLSYHGWFDGLLESLSDDTVKKKFSAAPYPTEVVKLLTDARKELPLYDPKAIAKQRQSATFLAANPTDDARKGYGPYYTREGDKLIDAVAGALTPANWPLLKTLDTTAAAYEKRGWMKPAAGIRALIVSARPPELPKAPAEIAERVKLVEPVDILANIDRTITASHTVTEIEGRWARIENEIKQLPQTHVPLLDAFPKFAEELPRSEAPASQPGRQPAGTLEDVKALASAFTSIDAVATQLVTDLNRKDREIVFAELAKDPAVQLPSDGKITLAMYSHLPDVTRGYFKLEKDPRLTVDWDHALAAVDNGMIAVIRKANPGDRNLPTLIEGRAALQKQLGELSPIAPIDKNREQVATLVARASSDLDKLTREGNEWVSPYIVHPDEYIAQQTERVNGKPPFATPAVAAQWQKASAAFLEKVKKDSAGLKVFQYETYQGYVATFKALDSDYAAFEAAIPATVKGLSTVEGTDWRHTIAQKVAVADREAALTELMTAPALHWNDYQPQIADAGYQSFERERLATYEKHRQEAVALIADYGTIESRLNGLYLLPDEPTKGSAAWRDLAMKWKNGSSPLFADAVVVAALKPLTDRVEALLALDGVNDFKGLADKAGDAQAEITLAAWRKLGTVAVDESTPVLDREEALQAHLSQELAVATSSHAVDESHAAALAGEMKAQRPLRWHRWADTLSGADQIQTALDKRAAFFVTLTPQRDARMMFNEAFYDLRKASDQGLKEAALKPIAAKFVKDVQAMPAEVSGDARIAAMLATISKPLQQSNEESSSAGAGPKLAGWEQDGSPNTAVRRFYYPNKASAKYTLEFERLSQQVGGKTVYLCNTEMPFGLFADTVNAPGKNGANRFSEITNNGRSGNDAHWFKTVEEPYDGPRIWKAVDGKLVLRTDPIPWLFKGTQDIAYYPANAPAGAASPEMPMQQLTPWAAMYGARLLGCRLPTSEEWKAAYQQFEMSGSLPRDGWNLRGAAYQVQQDYAKQLASSGIQFPDQGIFLTADLLFAGITAADAKPWHGDELVKLAPNRVSAGATPYRGSSLWFRKVGAEPGQPAPGSGAISMHDLVGNVAEMVYDGVNGNANGVLKDANATPAGIDAVLAAAGAESKKTGKANLFVIGGSSLSPPDIGITEPQPLDPEFPGTSVGFSDVGFRLAYTAPIDSINDVLATIFKDPKYLAAK